MADDSHKEKTEKVQIPELDVKEPMKGSVAPPGMIEKGTIPDLDPIHEAVKELAREKKTELEIRKWITISRSLAGTLLMMAIAGLVLWKLSDVLSILLKFSLDPTSDKSDKQLAISIVSLILGGAITFLLTNVMTYFDKKD